ncbi:hypothetical protein [Bradyrhizobium sp. SZCCHNRI2007]|uniref:hypothetical protein n=1 Tax=Bradyrhizobium sp. SZCCHNRI2007 TaxID=3057281 RepID=UPI0028E8374D|nr:hypothetical protein [Bradyrhizobium sp. SZCCHNRI2007]
MDSDSPPEISCHTDVAAKNIRPATAITFIESGRGAEIRAMAAGSAIKQGRPVRIWIICLVTPEHGHSMLAVAPAYCDVSESAELDEVEGHCEAVLQDFLNGSRGSKMQ